MTMEELSLDEWNSLLAGTLFPNGRQGISRLFLTSDHFAQLERETELTESEMVSSMYRAASACTIPEDIGHHVDRYVSFLNDLIGRIEEEHNGEFIDEESYEELLIEHQTSIVPPFLIHLVVIVHAYMSGEREGIDPIDVYRTVATEISHIMCVPNRLDEIHGDLVSEWATKTRKRPYALGSGTNRRSLGKHSPWGILKRWTELRSDWAHGGAITSDTIEVASGPHGSVRPIRYNAPFLSDDRNILEMIGKELRRESDVKPSDLFILEHIRRKSSNLSARAKRTLHDAFENTDEGAACFVDIVIDGFDAGPDSGPEGNGSESDEDSSRPHEPIETVRIEVKVLTDYYGELESSLKFVDSIESNDDFVLRIADDEIHIPADELNTLCSAPVEEYLPDGVPDLDLEAIGGNDLSRGERSLSIQSSGSFLKTLQPRNAVWMESVPSSGQRVLIVSKKDWAHDYADKVDMAIEREVTVKSRFSVDGEILHAIIGRWPVQRAISRTGRFDIDGGVRSSGGRNRYLVYAPPDIIYNGSRAQEDFDVIQTIDLSDGTEQESRLPYLDGGWTLEPDGNPCHMVVRVELEGDQKWTTEMQFVVVGGRWRDYLRSSINEDYRSGELILEPKGDWASPIPWESHRMLTQELRERALRSRRKDDLSKIDPLWISYEGARRIHEIKERARRATISRIQTIQHSPKVKNPKTRTEPVVLRSKTYVNKHRRGCGCMTCRKERHLIKNPTDEKAWQSYGKYSEEERKTRLEQLREKYLGRY